ncbi:hypothetical protein NHX12_023571 [Muraenolepis orangiensis]|uniref:Uncharacterized protein n=1 Tax=Muraenolepis orangiensis TaxID=630683 RepID=A0A9Q0EL07_9TELE|nr:hypothetical protein NHX12_023571 [Muraenolepis orangiensis]
MSRDDLALMAWRGATVRSDRCHEERKNTPTEMAGTAPSVGNHGTTSIRESDGWPDARSCPPRILFRSDYIVITPHFIEIQPIMYRSLVSSVGLRRAFTTRRQPARSFLSPVS